MSLAEIDDIERLKRINDALVNRVELAIDQQRNAFSLFQTAISLEGQVRRRTDELTSTLHSLEEANSELARQKEISERANQSKTRFLAAASHDILQPLNAAQLTISSLYDLQQTDAARSMVQQVERSLDTMNELLRTLLDISRLDAGVTKPNFAPVYLPHLIESVLSDLRPIAERKGLKLRTSIASESVLTDRSMLRRALQNLISNAIRYTEKGGILIGTRRAGDALSLEVIDTGCGIQEDQLETIFEEFHRGSHGKAAVADNECALGLGLSIVRRLVTALDHNMAVTSRPGSGSTFRIEVPIVPDAPAPAPCQTTRPAQPMLRDGSLTNKRVLVIENDPAVIEAMTLLMSNWEIDCRIVPNKERAIEAVSGNEWLPELIIADHHLDDGDLGTETLAALRNHLPHDVPAILATADTSKAVQARVDELGHEYMSKPVKPAQLRALMSHLIQSRNI